MTFHNLKQYDSIKALNVDKKNESNKDLTANLPDNWSTIHYELVKKDSGNSIDRENMQEMKFIGFES